MTNLPALRSGWTCFVWYGTTMCNYDYQQRAWLYYGITIDHQGYVL